jgi:hypothetical protein
MGMTPKQLHSKKRRARCPRCSHLSIILNNIVEPESGVTILFNIIDNCEQFGQQSIVQSCFHQHCINLSVFTRVILREPCITYNTLFQLYNSHSNFDWNLVVLPQHQNGVNSCNCMCGHQSGVNLHSILCQTVNVHLF